MIIFDCEKAANNFINMTLGKNQFGLHKTDLLCF